MTNKLDLQMQSWIKDRLMKSSIRFNLTFPQPTKHYNVKMYFVDDILTELVGDLTFLVRKEFINLKELIFIRLNVYNFRCMKGGCKNFNVELE